MIKHPWRKFTRWFATGHMRCPHCKEWLYKKNLVSVEINGKEHVCVGSPYKIRGGSSRFGRRDPLNFDQGNRE